MKRNVWLCQVNNRFGLSAFLPYSVGMLQAYAQSIPEIREAYDFRGFVFLREPIEDVIRDMYILGPPDVFACSLYIWNSEYTKALAKAVKEAFPECLIVLGGPHVPVASEGFFKEYPWADILIHYEGEVTFAEVLKQRMLLKPYNPHYGKHSSMILFMDIAGTTVNFIPGHKAPDRERISDLDSLPSPYLTGVFDDLMRLPYHFHATQETHRGCPYSCLSGDTPVDTVLGKIPIRELARDFKNMGVFTYDREERRAKVSTARNVRCTGKNKKLVRVRFDNGSHIDCTPDHRFLVFKWGNQFVGEREWVVEAKDLKPGTRVRAIREEVGDYVTVAWSRREREYKHRMIATWKIGRELLPGEEVHHMDRVKDNNLPDNLEVMSSKKEHVDNHPEVSQRMRENNPTRNGLSPQWKAKIGRSGKGKKRSPESRERYRQAASKREASKSPEERSRRARKSASTKRRKGVPMGNPNRNQSSGRFSGNHRVVSVEPLPGLHDVYCMEVPETGWFYANNVLVKNCTFCDWGSNTLAKVKSFSTERLAAEFAWMAHHRIDLLYNADANYGLLPRDLDLTERMVKVKNKYGYPNKFRAAYAKNSNEKVFNISKLLNDAKMSKGTTLSFQSMDDNTLQIVKRKNIKVKDFKTLIGRYRGAGIPTYSELIIGLPGESYDSFADGIHTLLEAGQHDSLQVYTCEVLPNSEMGHPEYRKVHEIQTAHTPVLHFHATPSSDPYPEFYELVIATKTLPEEDWMRCQMFAWVVQAFHCLGLTQAIAVFLHHYKGIEYRDFYESLLRFADKNLLTVIGLATHAARMSFTNLKGGSEWGFRDTRFGDIIWPVEEGSFLSCVVNRERFYLELSQWIQDTFGPETSLLCDLIAYQDAIVRAPGQKEKQPLLLRHNLYEYLESCYRGEPMNLTRVDSLYEILASNPSDLPTYAKEVVWYGRKGGKFQNEVVRRETLNG